MAATGEWRDERWFPNIMHKHIAQSSLTFRAWECSIARRGPRDYILAHLHWSTLDIKSQKIFKKMEEQGWNAKKVTEQSRNIDTFTIDHIDEAILSMLLRIVIPVSFPVFIPVCCPEL